MTGDSGGAIDRLNQQGIVLFKMISRILEAGLDLDRLLSLVLDLMVEATQAERGFIVLVDETGEIRVRAGRKLDPNAVRSPEFEGSRSIAKEVAYLGTALLVENALEDPRFKSRESVKDLQLRSVLCVPMASGGQVLGVVYLDHASAERHFRRDDLELAKALAERIAHPVRDSIRFAREQDRLAQVEAAFREGQRQLEQSYRWQNLVGKSPAMRELFTLVARVADLGSPVLIQGETGTGKELIARALHFSGRRKDKPFLAQNCAAIPEALCESELFGAARGAFTGADRDRPGLFESADGGTLFLDEIGSLAPGLQGKLLRVFQEGEVRRVGGLEVKRVDVRIVAAANESLTEAVEEGTFRQDLFYRLNVVPIDVPPLRDRREDIPLLVKHFVEKASARLGLPPREPEAAVLELYARYPWPGNVRELENEIERSLILSREPGGYGAAVVSPRIAQWSPDSGEVAGVGIKAAVDAYERTILEKTLAQNGGNRTKAAEALGITRRGLLKKLKRFGIG